ncbi:DUF6207 family protein [Streptomyces sp. NPDC003480]
MRPIRDEHVGKPELAVFDVASADDETAPAFQTALAAR